jgi:uncharacterized membrane protein (UPF0136 family)
MISRTDRIYEAHCLASATSAGLALAMGQRYVRTGKIMPAGVVAVAGAAACAYNITKAIEWAP